MLALLPLLRALSLALSPRGIAERLGVAEWLPAGRGVAEAWPAPPRWGRGWPGLAEARSAATSQRAPEGVSSGPRAAGRGPAAAVARNKTVAS